MTTRSYYRSPLGWLELCQTGKKLVSLKLVSGRAAKGALLKKDTALFGQLEAYFAKQKRTFSVPLGLEGTPFQNRVWKALNRVGYGQTASYKDIALRIGNPKSVRAVARAIGQNPCAILVPCHRIIGSDGSLTGYAYGLKKKAWLLKHEGN